MANHRRTANGSVSNFAQMQTWDGSSWVASTGMPVAGDTLHANGFNTVLDVDLIDVDIRNNINFNGTAQSGRFEILSAGITYKGTRYASTNNATPVLFVSFGGGVSSVLGGASTSNLHNSSSLVQGHCGLLINGQAGGVLMLETTGSASGPVAGRAVEANGAGNGFVIEALEIVGCDHSSTNRWVAGLLVNGNGYVIRCGLVEPFPAGSGGALNVRGVGNVIEFNGIVEGSSIASNKAVGAAITSGNVIAVNGIAEATQFSPAIVSLGLSQQSGWPLATVSNVILNGVLVSTVQFPAVGDMNYKLPDTPDDTLWEMKTPTNSDRMFYTAGLLTGYPPETKVEDQYVFGPSGEFAGTLVPVNVDVQQLASDLLTEMETSNLPIAVRMRNTATDDFVTTAVAAITPAP